ncbi:MAG TPA: SAM-dependent methyltransferase [Spirochaetota bacterium]|nr:SAM-dependent methyltransferase [Spirochaetota bacterium]
MKESSSTTAVDTLASRAIASIAPRRRRILHDPFARSLLPAHWLVPKFYFWQARFNPLVYPISVLIADLVSPGGVLQIALRHRHMDECLARAIRDGVRRIVILGAGYDSRCMRFRTDGVEFIEIDHPHTQNAKHRRLDRINGGPVPGVRYLPIDFCGDWAADVAREIGATQHPAFFIWEGVAYYLPEEAVRYTLAAIRRFSPTGGRIVFDMFPRGIADPACADPVLRKMRRYGERHREHFQWGCERSEMPGFLTECGLRLDSTITLREYADRLRADEGIRIGDAAVLARLYNVEASW